MPRGCDLCQSRAGLAPHATLDAVTPEHPLAILLGLAVAATILVPWPALRRWRYAVSLALVAGGTVIAWSLEAAGLLDAVPHRVVSGGLAVASFVVIAIQALYEGREDRERERDERHGVERDGDGSES